MTHGHLSMRWRLRAVAIASALGVVALPLRTSAASTLPTLAAVAVAAPMSLGESAGNQVDERDGGYSTSLGNGTSIWIFGDSQVVGPAPSFSFRRFVTGSTAAIGPTAPGVAPTALREVVVGHGLGTVTSIPNHFLANPTSLAMPAGTTGGCVNANDRYPARWPTGVARLGSSRRVLVTYDLACVFSATSYTFEGSGVAIFDTSTGRFTLAPTDVERPTTSPSPTPRWFWGSPVVEPNGVLDVFATSFDPSGASTVVVAQLVPSVRHLVDRTSYHPVLATTTTGTAFPLGTFSFGLYRTASGPAFFAVEDVDHAGGIVLWRAPKATGPWAPIGTASLPGCILSALYCWTEEGHPDLSTPDSLVVTYYRPGDPALGLDHLAAVAIELPPPTSP